MVADIKVPVDLAPAYEVDLIGLDSNAGSIMGAVSRGLKKEGNSTEIIDCFRAQCMEGDYDHLLRTAMVFVGDLD